jgi:hypothetical protein
LKLRRLILVFGVLVLVTTLGWEAGFVVAQGEEDNLWYVHDMIYPSLGEVHWTEEGGTRLTPPWISDGSWIRASMSQSLVNSNDIFVSIYEEFNWPLVRPIAEAYYATSFSSFSSFEKTIADSPGPWLRMSWQIDTHWYGVPLDTTKIVASFNQTSQVAELWTWLHITRVPEYLVGEGNLENWLTGFDLTPVSTGSLTLWEVHKDYNDKGTYYNLRFEAPADVLVQHGDTFNCTIPVARSYWGNVFKIHQVIDINMPADTEASSGSPVDMAVFKANTATFLIFTGDTYPAMFSATSGPASKTLSQVILDNAGVALLSPGGWAAVGSILVLSFTAFRGRKVWQRNKRYHHIYNGMVTLYDLYNKDSVKLNKEMDNLSKASVKMVLDDQITDEQFEKLLRRRDDLVDRAAKQSMQP